MKQVWLQHSVFDRIQHEADSKAPLETGGLLIGYCSADDDHVVVTDMVGPGPAAKHRKGTYRPDYSYHRREMNRIFVESRGMLTYVGDWHSHPSASSYLSFLDKRALRNIASFPDNYINRPIMMVLGGTDTGHFTEWTLGIWRISPQVHKFPWSRWEYVPIEITVFD